MDVAAYLARIAYAGAVRPDAKTLRDLHRAHLYSVPFENLDISLGRQIRCEEARFLHKVVNLRRGGFCYELNGAFAALLRALGYRVSLLSARVTREDGSASPEFDHLALLVELDEPWLADVGFGDSFLEPLGPKKESEQEQPGGPFRIVPVGNVMMVQRRLADQNWRTLYQFTLKPHALGDFEPRCQWQQTSPDSHFVQQRICTRATPEGRITLSELKLIRTTHGKREERMLANEDEWHAALVEHFGVRL